MTLNEFIDELIELKEQLGEDRTNRIQIVKPGHSDSGDGWDDIYEIELKDVTDHYGRSWSGDYTEVNNRNKKHFSVDEIFKVVTIK